MTENKKNVKKNNKFFNTLKSFCKKYSVATYVCIGIALFFLSLMLVAQMKTISNTEEVLQGKREAQLSDELVNLQRNYNELKSKYDENQKALIVKSVEGDGVILKSAIKIGGEKILNTVSPISPEAYNRIVSKRIGKISVFQLCSGKRNCYL